MGRRSHNDCGNCKGGIVSYRTGEPCQTCNSQHYQEWLARNPKSSNPSTKKPAVNTPRRRDLDELVAMKPEEKAHRSELLAALRAETGL